jgi:hypothetical protein
MEFYSTPFLFLVYIAKEKYYTKSIYFLKATFRTVKKILYVICWKKVTSAVIFYSTITMPFLFTRGGRKVRLIDLPIPIRSSDCIGRYNRLMPSSDFWIGRLCRFVLSSDSLIVRSCFLVLSSDFWIGWLCRFDLSSDSLIVRSCFLVLSSDSPYHWFAIDLQ